MSIVYRTDDISRWGLGQGSDLSATTIDLNFWQLSQDVTSLQAALIDNTTVSIDFINVNANQMFIHLTNHAVEGPFTIPSTVWNPRGDWTAGGVHYKPNDIVSVNGQLYLVQIDHLSGSSFSPLATDGSGHNLYTLILEDPHLMLPDGGTAGQKLIKAAGSPFQTQWQTDYLRGTIFISGEPDDGELLLEWPIVDNLVFPQGLARSVVFPRERAAATATIAINKNDVGIGTIIFSPSPAVSVNFPADITCVPGDVISLIAPSPQDATLADISMTLVAELLPG